MTIPVITEHGSPKQHFKLSNSPSKSYGSPAEAKADCWRRFGEIAIRLYDNSEAQFDAQNPLHAALARIEARYSPVNSVVAVGAQWYLIRRSKFGVEVKVTYSQRDNTVYARSNDSEPLEPQ